MMETKEKKQIHYFCHTKDFGVTIARVKSEKEMVNLMKKHKFILKAQGLLSGLLTYQGTDTRVFSIIERDGDTITTYTRYKKNLVIDDPKLDGNK